MNRILLGWVLLVGFCFSSYAYNESERPKDVLDISFQISNTDPERLPVGEPIRYQCTLRNRSNETINLITPVDGSSRGRRYPVYEIRVKSPIPLPRIPVFPGCGNINPLLLSDFLPLEPGEEYRMTEETCWQGTEFVPLVAGRYEFSYVVNFDADRMEFTDYPLEVFDWTDAFAERMSRVPRIDIQSATMTVNYVSNGKTKDSAVHCLMGMPRDEIRRLYFRDQEDTLREYENGYQTGIYRIDLPPGSFMLPCYRMMICVHLNEEKVVDGIQVLEADHLPDPIPESLLVWLRGNEAESREQIVRNGDRIMAIYLGSLTPTSGINFMPF